MLKGFRDFLLRGNIVDLAVGVVIGVAFGNVVTQLTKSFLEPLIKLVTGGHQVGGVYRVNGVAFDYGAFINVVVTFVLTAAVLYFVVVTPMNKLATMRKSKGVPPEPAAPSPEVALLTEIRDALCQGQPPAATPRATSASGPARLH